MRVHIGNYPSGLTNDIEFTAEGTILVSVEKDKINNNNETIIVSVKDPGQGIDASILPRLFTKFTSTSYKGTARFVHI